MLSENFRGFYGYDPGLAFEWRSACICSQWPMSATLTYGVFKYEIALGVHSIGFIAQKI